MLNSIPENSNKPEIVARDIRIAYILAIVYGIAGLFLSIISPFLTPEDKRMLAPHFEYTAIDLAWNIITNCFSIWWGLRIQRNPSKRLVSLTNLLGLYAVKTGIVVFGLFYALPHIMRLAYLLPALFIIFLGWRAQIEIQKAQESPIRARYKIRLLAWLVVPLIIAALGAVLTYFANSFSGELLTALENRDANRAMLAVKNGENPNQIMFGQPLIFMGIKEGDDFYVKTLVQAGADINIKSNWGRTPLHQAALHGQVEIAEFLLQHGADVNARNNRGETPLFYAEGGIIAGPKPTDRHREVARMLRQYGGTK